MISNSCRMLQAVECRIFSSRHRGWAIANSYDRAAFGYHAGYAGAALAIQNWAHQLLNPKTPLPSVEAYDNAQDLVKDVKKDLEQAMSKNNNEYPRIIIIGALGMTFDFFSLTDLCREWNYHHRGIMNAVDIIMVSFGFVNWSLLTLGAIEGRCGTGAKDLCKAAGLPSSSILCWDLEETKSPGPYKEVIESDIFVNCIYLTKPTPVSAHNWQFWVITRLLASALLRERVLTRIFNIMCYQRVSLIDYQSHLLPLSLFLIHLESCLSSGTFATTTCVYSDQ